MGSASQRGESISSPSSVSGSKASAARRWRRRSTTTSAPTATTLAATGVKHAPVQVRNDAPQVVVSYQPSILVPVNGAPVWQPVPGSSRFQRADCFGLDVTRNAQPVAARRLRTVDRRDRPQVLDLPARVVGNRGEQVGERFLLVQADDVIYASLNGDTISIVTGHVAGTSNYRTLDELQASLDPDVFWRVHRSHLVNINKIKEIVPWFSRNYILRMKDAKSTEIPVSRSQTKRLRDYLKL